MLVSLGGNQENTALSALGKGVEGFLPGEKKSLKAKSNGPLAGLRFAVKDNIDIANSITGAGNLHWAKTHKAATKSAPVVDELLFAGASMVGKTITEELA